MFDVTADLELSNEKAETSRKRKRERAERCAQEGKWYERAPVMVEEDELFLGGVESEVFIPLSSLPVFLNYTPLKQISTCS